MRHQKVLVVYYAVIGIVMIVGALTNPRYNWDIIGYIACAKNYEIHDTKVLHEYTYNELKRSLPEANYVKLLQGQYSKSMSENTEVFDQLLPFYRNKYIYIFLVFMLSKLGINIVFASHLISAVSVFLGLWILYFAFNRYIDSHLLFVLPVVGIALGLFYLSRFSTPDGLTFLTVCVIAFLLLRSHWGIILALPLAVLIRPDLIIFSLLVLVYVYCYYKQRILFSLVILILLAGSYLWVSVFSQCYSWRPLFHFAFIDPSAEMIDANADIRISDYLLALQKGMKQMILSPRFMSFVSISALAGVMYVKAYGWRIHHDNRRNRIYLISLLSVLYVAVHFFLYPAVWTRYFVGQYMLVVVGFLALLSENHKRTKT